MTRTCLFGFKGEFDEDLLKLLVNEVDAKLLEAILLEYLKSINIQDAQIEESLLLESTGQFHRRVYPLEQQQQILHVL